MTFILPLVFIFILLFIKLKDLEYRYRLGCDFVFEIPYSDFQPRLKKTSLKKRRFVACAKFDVIWISSFRV